MIHVIYVKKKWFDLIASGEKKEEYRELKPYWQKRLLKFKKRDLLKFKNGYNKNSDSLIVEFKGYTIKKPNSLWTEIDNIYYDCYAIHLGEIISWDK